MDSQRTGLRVAAVILAIFGLAHILRLWKQFDVVIAGHSVPLWINVVAAIVAVGLSIWFWGLSKK